MTDIGNFPTTVIKLVPWIEALGIIAFCISGFIRAQQHKFDPIGVFIIGFVTAFGGGTLRDLLLDRRPFYWVEHQNYVIALFVLSLVAGKVLHFMRRVFTNKSMLIADALGLGLFTITSTALWPTSGTSISSPVATPEEIPDECGVMGLDAQDHLVCLREAPQRPFVRLRFDVWMALARATPVRSAESGAQQSF